MKTFLGVQNGTSVLSSPTPVARPEMSGRKSTTRPCGSTPVRRAAATATTLASSWAGGSRPKGRPCRPAHSRTTSIDQDSVVRGGALELMPGRRADRAVHPRVSREDHVHQVADRPLLVRAVKELPHSEGPPADHIRRQPAARAACTATLLASVRIYYGDRVFVARPWTAGSDRPSRHRALPARRWPASAGAPIRAGFEAMAARPRGMPAHDVRERASMGFDQPLGRAPTEPVRALVLGTASLVASLRTLERRRGAVGTGGGEVAIIDGPA